MSFEDNPMDERYQLDQCIDEIRRLQEQLQQAEAERDALRVKAAMVARNAVPGHYACELAADAILNYFKKGGH